MGRSDKESSMNPLQKIVKRLREINQLERLTDQNKHNNIHPTNQVRFTNQNIKNS